MPNGESLHADSGCGSDIGVTDVLLIFSLGIEILLSMVGRVSKKLTGRDLSHFLS
jgi:hypothetical protein